jgi:hypothetical protein
MKNDEIKKGLREIKAFMISEIKNSESNWQKNKNRDEIEYRSKWLNIRIPCDEYKKNGKDITIYLKGDNSYHTSSYRIKDIGLSRIRFNWIIRYNVDFFIKNQEERQKMESLVNNWNNFLKNNKSLNRDNKIDKILK